MRIYAVGFVMICPTFKEAEFQRRYNDALKEFLEHMDASDIHELIERWGFSQSDGATLVMRYKRYKTNPYDVGNLAQIGRLFCRELDNMIDEHIQDQEGIEI